MATIEKAVETLVQAERRLRDLVGRAAADGEYDVVDCLTEAARAIGAIARNWRNGNASENTPDTPTTGTNPAARRKAHFGRTEAAAGKKDRGRGSGLRSKPTAAKGEYPKFFRRGDQLVKVGWSKKRREEYVHKAPRRVFEALATVIARRSASGKVFPADEIFSSTRPLRDPEDGSELPGYQAYVALAWFKKAGLVRQHGRSGYSVKNGSRLPHAAMASWQALPRERVQA